MGVCSLLELLLALKQLCCPDLLTQPPCLDTYTVNMLIKSLLSTSANQIKLKRDKLRVNNIVSELRAVYQCSRFTVSVSISHKL